MAYTRIHGIKTTLNKALDYIENPEKTEDQLLVYGYNVDPLSASIEFRMTVALAKEIKGDYSKTGGADNLAYHMIQSFAPYDKITAKEAHELGKKWADEILGGKYEYVLSTHVDKGHIHNHIIFNATSFFDHSKFDNYKVASHLRKVSDRLCKEHGLFVIENPNLKNKSPSHFEWEQKKNGNSWKDRIKNIIDRAITESTDYESFIRNLQAEKVEVKEGKRISFRLVDAGQERFCRGDRIGEEYSKEFILQRLLLPKNQVVDFKENAKNKMVLSLEENTPEYKSFDKKIEFRLRETRIAETKELAAALLTIRHEKIEYDEDFKKRIDELSANAVSVKSLVIELESKNKKYKEVAKYLLAYSEFLPFKEESIKQSFFSKKKYEALHEGELEAFNHAVQQLEKAGVNLNVDPKKVTVLVKDHEEKILKLNTELKQIFDKIETIRRAEELVSTIGKGEKTLQQEKEKGANEVCFPNI